MLIHLVRNRESIDTYPVNQNKHYLLGDKPIEFLRT